MNDTGVMRGFKCEINPFFLVSEVNKKKVLTEEKEVIKNESNIG